MELNKDQTRMYVLGYSLVALVGATISLSAWQLSGVEREPYRLLFGLPVPQIVLPGFVHLGIVMFFLATFAILLAVGVFSGLHKWGFNIVNGFLAPVLGLVIVGSAMTTWLGSFVDLAGVFAGDGDRPKWLGYLFLYSGFIGILVYTFFLAATVPRAWLGGRVRVHHPDGVGIVERGKGAGTFATTLLLVGFAFLIGLMIRRQDR